MTVGLSNETPGTGKRRAEIPAKHWACAVCATAVLCMPIALSFAEILQVPGIGTGCVLVSGDAS